MKNLIIAIALISICSGCSVLEPTEDNTRYYVFSAGASESLSQNTTQEKVAIGLGPVQLPAYLDNPWIAVRESDVEIGYAQSHQWGEPLEQGIQRVLRDNLESLLGTADITIMRQTRRSNARYVIRLDFSQFELTAQNEAVLSVSWRITNPAVENFERAGIFDMRAPFASGDLDYTDGVSALSEVLNGLSTALAKAVHSED